MFDVLEPLFGDVGAAAAYVFQASAQVCIDMANHVIASEGWRSPADFRDGFSVLEENDVVDKALAERMRELAGMRNVLVHRYDDVDDGRVHAALPSGVDDLDAFAPTIARLLD